MANRNGDLKCHICGRAFRLQSSLKVHISIHKHDGVLEEKYAEGANTTDRFIQEEVLNLLEKCDSPNKCQYCGKQYTLSSCLKTHIIACKIKSSSHCNDVVVKNVPSLDIRNKSLSRDEPLSSSSDVSEDKILDSLNDLDCQEIDEKRLSRSTDSSTFVFPTNDIESVSETEVLTIQMHSNSLQFGKLRVEKLPPDSIETFKKVNSKINRLKIIKLRGTNDSSKVKNENCKNKNSKNAKTDLSGSVDTGLINPELRQEVGETMMFLCETCGKTFTKIFQLRRHMKYHSSKFKCLTCEKVFLCQLTLSRHIDSKQCRGEGKTCKYCSQKFSKKVFLVQHIRSDHKGEIKKKKKSLTIQCDICNKVITRRSFAVHKRTHTGERRYQCDVCGACFVQSHHLSRHKDVHTKPAFQCKVCNVSYIQEEALRKHILKSHQEKDIEDIEECITMRARDEMKKCSQCDSQFFTNSQLWQHERTYSHQLRRKKCSYCDRKFQSNFYRILHERLHTGEKPEKCSFCDKAFRLPQALKVHLRIHTGDRPFKCKTCGKSFIQKPHLLTHEILHTGEKPFECQYCGVSFASKSNLLAHIKKNCKQVSSV